MPTVVIIVSAVCLAVFFLAGFACGWFSYEAMQHRLIQFEENRGGASGAAQAIGDPGVAVGLPATPRAAGAATKCEETLPIEYFKPGDYCEVFIASDTDGLVVEWTIARVQSVFRGSLDGHPRYMVATTERPSNPALVGPNEIRPFRGLSQYAPVDL